MHILTLVLFFFCWFITSYAQATTEARLDTLDQTTLVASEMAVDEAKFNNPAVVPVPSEINPTWMERHLAKLKEIHERPIDLVFIGDSIFQDWELDGPEPSKVIKPIWDNYFGTLNAINLGFGGDTTANVLWRLEHGEIDGVHPKVIVLLIGTNNTGRMRWSAEQTTAGIESIVELIHEKLPDTKLVLLGILPCRLFSQNTNVRINDSLSGKYRNSEFVMYLDLADIFMKNGKLEPSYFIEGATTPPTKLLHPSSDGQERMAIALKPLLLRLMSEKGIASHAN